MNRLNLNTALFSVSIMIFFIGKPFMFFSNETEKLYGVEFDTVVIGDQTWCKYNLSVIKFRNGDAIPFAKSSAEWKKAGLEKKPACCFFDNDTSNRKNCGLLYNWYAVSDPRGLAPKGWHIPTEADWNILVEYLGGEEEAGTKMKSTENWQLEGNGTNSGEFFGLPCGIRTDSATFDLKGTDAVWWSSEAHDANHAKIRGLNYYYGSVASDFNMKKDGIAVRLIKD